MQIFEGEIFNMIKSTVCERHGAVSFGTVFSRLLLAFAQQRVSALSLDFKLNKKTRLRTSMFWVIILLEEV